MPFAANTPADDIIVAIEGLLADPAQTQELINYFEKPNNTSTYTQADIRRIAVATARMAIQVARIKAEQQAVTADRSITGKTLLKRMASAFNVGRTTTPTSEAPSRARSGSITSMRRADGVLIGAIRAMYRHIFDGSAIVDDPELWDESLPDNPKFITDPRIRTAAFDQIAILLQRRLVLKTYVATTAPKRRINPVLGVIEFGEDGAPPPPPHADEDERHPPPPPPPPPPPRRRVPPVTIGELLARKQKVWSTKTARFMSENTDFTVGSARDLDVDQVLDNNVAKATGLMGTKGSKPENDSDPDQASYYKGTAYQLNSQNVQKLFRSGALVARDLPANPAEGLARTYVVNAVNETTGAEENAFTIHSARPNNVTFRIDARAINLQSASGTASNMQAGGALLSSLLAQTVTSIAHQAYDAESNPIDSTKVNHRFPKVYCLDAAGKKATRTADVNLQFIRDASFECIGVGCYPKFDRVTTQAIQAYIASTRADATLKADLTKILEIQRLALANHFVTAQESFTAYRLMNVDPRLIASLGTPPARVTGLDQDTYRGARRRT